MIIRVEINKSYTRESETFHLIMVHPTTEVESPFSLKPILFIVLN